MKSKTQILRGAWSIAGLTLMTLLTTGCGMKGALYLPETTQQPPQPSIAVEPK